MSLAAQVVGSILKHDRKVNSYKLALIRSINDVVLSYPDLADGGKDVAVPVRRLAQYWVAYYWPFTDRRNPIFQGPRAARGATLANDMAFRPALTNLKDLWEDRFGASRPSDGFLLVAELRVARIARSYPPELRRSFRAAVSAISKAVEQPIRYAGPGGTKHAVFPPPQPAAAWPGSVRVPGTSSDEASVLVSGELWAAFRDLSLWIEALCVHEWSLFTEGLSSSGADRGLAYSLLTSRPDNRRPLTWERNQVDLLMREGREFVCPWTEKRLGAGRYAIDHIVPVSVYPTNELWNLVPSDERFNSHVKRARMPTTARMAEATPRLARTYEAYAASLSLRGALDSDVGERFALPPASGPEAIARAVARTTLAIADARSVERFW
ncbi:MAG: hypothetical protein CYG60_03020 [Actinobacteria bacterium]|nr:HNH endonuclease [Actinomycetota bacterium]PLS87229.1 MAG: hypothetical protein CYG60_03020 [Actinomycetota bacterium]